MVYGCQIWHVYSLGIIFHSSVWRMDDVRKRNDNRGIPQSIFEQFDPVDYDPKKVGSVLQKRAGMKYAVLTAKHHDGFCLFDSKLTDYKSTNTKAGRDLVKEFVEACREGRTKGGSLFFHYRLASSGFSKYGDRQHPMRNNPAYKDEKIDFDRYLEYMHGQIKELVTGYGKLDLLWFDFSYDDMTGEKWKATELIKMVRKYQPDVIIDNRLEGAGDNHGSITTEKPLIYSGDFASPEQIIPPKGVCDDKGEPIPWELCATMNNHWGYCNFDHQYKTPQMLVRKLVECASKGGNMIPERGTRCPWKYSGGECSDSHRSWKMDEKKWGESIYGCGISKLKSQIGEDIPRKVTSFMLMFMRHRLEHFRSMESDRISWNRLHILQMEAR